MSKGIVKDIDKGFYQEAREKGIHPLTYLTQLVNPEPPEIFPAFLASQIIAGQLAVSLVPVCCLAEVRISSHVQEKVSITDTTDSRQTKHVSEGQELPKTTIAKTQGSIALQKYGRMLE